MKNNLTGLLGILALTLASTVQAETVDCNPITSVPYTITTPGVYCLVSSVSSNDPSQLSKAITIASDNVVLDLNGHMLDGSGAGLATAATGISAHQRSNITIRNGAVRGFSSGIYLGDVQPNTVRGIVIEDIRAIQNTNIGIVAKGIGALIRNNQVLATGGSTFSSSGYGIVINGPGMRVLNNEVIGVTSYGISESVGISLSASNNSMVADNRISTIASAAGVGNYGVQIGHSTNVILKDNILNDMKYGVHFIYSTGKYMNNMTQGVTTPYTGGTAAGTTNY